MISAIPNAMTHASTRSLFIRFGLIALIAPVLAACGLGYNKNPPNEFNVVRRAPLILPPEFELRPPDGSRSAPVSKQGAELARLVVLRTPNTERQPDALEQRMLDEAARGGVYGDGVRQTLEAERSGKRGEDAELVDKLTADESTGQAE